MAVLSAPVRSARSTNISPIPSRARWIFIRPTASGCGSIGTEPGTGKGVKVPGHLGPAHCDIAADYFFSEGYAVVAHRDPAWINRPDPGPQESQKGKSEETV
jgi:hypothetical protein